MTQLIVAAGYFQKYSLIRCSVRYDGEEYVWPFVEEVRHEYVSVPEDQLNVMRVLLSEFSGICCLGYKLRRDGSICIFEASKNRCFKTWCYECYVLLYIPNGC